MASTSDARSVPLTTRGTTRQEPTAASGSWACTEQSASTERQAGSSVAAVPAPQSAIQEEDMAMLDLLNQRDQLVGQLKRVDKMVVKDEEAMKSLILTGKEAEAMVALKKKMHEQMALECNSKLEEVILNIEQANVQKIVVEADRDVVLEAVSAHGLALRHATPDLQADTEVVLAAVASSVDALEFASPVLQADRDIVLAAASKGGGALRFAFPELRGDRELVLEASRLGGGDALRGAPEVIKRDREVVLAAVAQNAPQRLRADRRFVHDALARDQRALAFFSKDIQTDPPLPGASCSEAQAEEQDGSAKPPDEPAAETGPATPEVGPTSRGFSSCFRRCTARSTAK